MVLSKSLDFIIHSVYYDMVVKITIPNVLWGIDYDSDYFVLKMLNNLSII